MSCVVAILLFSVYHRFSYQIKFRLTVKFCVNAFTIKLDDIFRHQNITFVLMEDFHVYEIYVQAKNVRILLSISNQK